MKYVVIDLDSLGFIVAYNQYIALENRVDDSKVRNHVHEFVNAVLRTTEADKFCLVHQARDSVTFRKQLYANYKANRGESPDFIKHWKDVVYEAYRELEAVGVKNIESDDFLSIVHKTFDHDNHELILAHNDKDMFQLFGRHYMYKKNEWHSVSKEEAELNLYKQMLTGDGTDNIIGCGKRVTKVYASGVKKGEKYMTRVGVGPKEAVRILQDSDNMEDTVKNKFVDTFGVSTGALKFAHIKTLIKLLDPDQTYEKIEFEWKDFNNTESVSSLFDSDTTADGLFD
jgi:5'-3' exonuclease